MRLTALRYGTTELPLRWGFANADTMDVRPIALLFFLLEAEERRLLIDVGCDTMPGFPLHAHISPAELLIQCGIEPASITDVILTHAHHDHADGLRHVPTARLYIHEAALSSLAAESHRGEICTFMSTCEIMPGVLVRHIGGHARGSSVVEIARPDTIWLLCGDEIYFRENLTRGIPTATSVDPEASRRFVETYAHPAYTPILFHAPDVVDGIGAKVLFEDSI